MIPASDLRIGNLITWNARLRNPGNTLPPLHVEVVAILHDRISYVSPGIEYRVEPFEDDLQQFQLPFKSLEEFEPIPLTSELLSGAGFAYTKISKEAGWFGIRLTNKDLRLYLEKDEFYFELSEKQTFPVKSVHQLQNLYFAITGAELDIKLLS